MAHLEGFDFGISMIEEINVDHDKEAQEYMIKMYERIKRLETPTPDAIQSEILETTSTSGSSSSITYSDDTLQECLPSPDLVKKMIEIDVDDETYIAPIFIHIEQLREWNKVLAHHERRINDIVEKLKHIGKAKEVETTMFNVHKRVNEWVPKETKDKSKIDALRRTVLISATEKCIEKELGELGLKLQNVSTSVDSITQGLWIKEHESSEIQQFLDDLGTKRIVLTQRYKFNSQQTENLIKMMFSSKPEIRAKAKLDLMSRIDRSIQQDLLKDAGKVLEIIFAEAYLTQTEILYMLFQINDRSNDHVCISCMVPIKLDQHIYHARCKVIEWLIAHARFAYDDVEQYLHFTKTVYIDGNQRAIINSLLKIHAQLKRDVVYRTATETIIYKREDDGRLTKVEARRQRESDIIGSYAWRVQHGMTPPQSNKGNKP